jgi:mono/diheme cytochrome c family protein
MKVSAIILLVLLAAQCSVGNRIRGEEHGRSVFLGNCVGCHGEEAVGQDPSHPEGKWLESGVELAPALTEKGHAWVYPPELLFQRIKSGLSDENPSMPQFENTISDEEIILVIRYLFSLWPEDVQQRYIERYGDSPIVREI